MLKTFRRVTHLTTSRSIITREFPVSSQARLMTSTIKSTTCLQVVAPARSSAGSAYSVPDPLLTRAGSTGSTLNAAKQTLVAPSVFSEPLEDMILDGGVV